MRETIFAMRYDPLAYVMYAFPWGRKGHPLEHKQPRKWFVRLCNSISAKLKANAHRPGHEWEVIQEAIASGHGIGKSAGIVGMLGMWAMSTFPMTKGVVTANTDTQLRTKTWPELTKWHGYAINSHWFTITATSLYSNWKDASGNSLEKLWRLDAIPWSENNTEAFAGLHNEGKRIVLIFDEASAIADPVWETAEGALTDAGTEILWVVAGNPTRARGRFRECFTKQRELWTAVNVDSRTVEGINLSRVERWARIYGEDSQFFNVRVKGQFVEADANQLIATEWIAEARMRGKQHVVPDGSMPRLRITVDVADGGEDDTVVTVTRHYQSFRHVLKQKKFSFSPSVAVIEAGEAVARMWDAYGGNAENGDDIVVDSLGVGAGTAGFLMKKGLPVVQYKGGESSSNPKAFRNRRVQSYIALRNDMRDGFVIFAPDMLEDEEEWTEFEEQLCSVRGKPGTDKLEDLQTKEEMKRDGIKSPDHADSLAMQYATQYPTISLGGSEDFAPAVVPSTILEGYVG